MFRKALYLTMTIGLVASLPWLTSLALFTDQDAIAANTFASGTIVLTTTPSTALITYSAMFPGDSVTSQLTLDNDGTGELRYAMTTTETETVLSGVMTLMIKSGLATCNSANMDDVGLGTTLYSGVIKDAAIGDPTQGSQAGDRTLAATTGTENLCSKAALPSSAGNSLQGITSTMTFTFDSEQTKNNA